MRCQLVIVTTLFLLLPNVILAETRELTATLTNADVIVGGANGSTSPLSGTARFLLTWNPDDPANTMVSYEIKLDADLDGTQTADLNDDVTAIHFHDVNVCVADSCVPGDTAGTLHVLNTFGVPRNDDADMQFFPSAGEVTGLWDAADANTLTPAPSFAPGTVLDQILNGETFVMVHTRKFPGGAFGGFIVPEPTSLALMWLGMGVVFATLRRSRRR